MSEKINDDKKVLVMLVNDQKEGKKVKAVTGLEENGELKTADPKQKNLSNFFGVNSDNGIEAFFKKLMEQTQNPSHTGLYFVSANVLDKIIKLKEPELSKELEPHRVDPKEVLKELRSQKQGQSVESSTTQKQGENEVSGSKMQPSDDPASQKTTFQPLDENRIAPGELERLGIKSEDLEPNMKAMLYGHKSPRVIPMNPIVEGERVATKGRLLLEESPDGLLRFVPFYCKNQLDLDAPFHGILFTDQDKENLLKTGNLGRVVELEPIPGQKVSSFVSVDKLTNRIEALPVDKIHIPKRLKDKDLSPEQQQELGEGKKVLVEGMKSRTGKLFPGYIQINAAEIRLDFTFDGLLRNRFAQENKQRGIVIHDYLLGKKLTPEQQEDLRNYKTVYVKDMIKPGQVKPFSAYVKGDREEGKLKFYTWNPDRAKKQVAEVTPVNESNTKVAVNSEGKTDETIKKVQEPLKQEKQKPTESQRRWFYKKPAVKSSGQKM